MKKGFTALVLWMFVSALIIPGFGQKSQSFEIPSLVKKQSTEFLSINAYSDGQGVWVSWNMDIEVKNIGFNVYRFDGFEKVKANESLIGGGFLRSNKDEVIGASYGFYDPQGTFTTNYQIESFDVASQTKNSSIVSPTFVRDITPFAGSSSDSLTKASKQKNHLINQDNLILPKQLSGEILDKALFADPNNQKYIASQPGVKIGVNKEGFYRVSKTALQNGGFNVTGNPANWQLFVEGEEVAITIGVNADYIEFYGKGIDTLDSATQIYFLINGSTPGKRIQTSVIRRIGGTAIASSYDASTKFEERTLYITKLRNGKATNFTSSRVINTTGVSVNFDVKAIDFNSPTSKIEVGAQGLTTLPHNVQVSLNGQSLGNITGNNFDLMTGQFQIPTSRLNEGTNTLFFQTPAGSTSISFFDFVKVDYERLYKAQDNALSFYTNYYRNSTLRGFTSSNVRLFDTTDQLKPTLVTNLTVANSGGSFSVNLPANRSKRIFAVEDSAILQPVSIEINNPSTLSTTNHNAELIIISYKGWMNESNNWANYRIADGLTVEVVDIADIYDEFNFGVTKSDSIRDFSQFAKTNWQTPPKYLFLMGDATYDPRDYGNIGNFNFVPTDFVDTLYEQTGSDESLVDFDQDGFAELAIGRIPNRTAADLTLALNKTMTFEQTIAQAMNRGAFFASDCPNGYDFAGLSRRLGNELPAGTSKSFVDRCLQNGAVDPAARQDVLNNVDAGKFLVNYSGHGSLGVWVGTGFYSSNDVPNIANGTSKLSIFTMLTCLNGYFVHPAATSLSEHLLFSPNGGGVVVWASTGETTPDVQEVMAKKFYQNFSDTNMRRLGDSIKVSKLSVLGGRDVRLSWALLGDPTLKIR